MKANYVPSITTIYNYIILVKRKGENNFVKSNKFPYTPSGKEKADRLLAYFKELPEAKGCEFKLVHRRKVVELAELLAE